MANLRDIRNRITSVNNMQQITKAMKMVAAARLRKAQQIMLQTRPFATKIEEVAGRLAENRSDSNDIMRNPEEVNTVLFIVIGSDRGLCGGFNNNLFREIEIQLRNRFSEYLSDNRLSMVTIGRKATAYFSKRKYDVVQKHPGFFDQLDYNLTAEVMNKAVQEFVDGKYDEVYIAFNEFKSVIAQKRTIQKVLPIDIENIGKAESDNASKSSIDYIYEPDAEAILSRLLPLHLNMQLWRAVLESNASEQGARMTAMDSATENAKDLERELRLQYNQARQSAITTEISEIVSGAQALQES